MTPPLTFHVTINGPTVIWVNGATVPVHSANEGKWLIKLFLDAGVEVKGYWMDMDYSGIDPRIGLGSVRHPGTISGAERIEKLLAENPRLRRSK